MKRLFAILVCLCFTFFLNAKIVKGTFIYYNIYIEAPCAYPVCIDGFFEKKDGLEIRLCNQEALVYGLIHNSYICPFLLGMDSSAYSEIFQQKFGKEEGLLMYISELQKISEAYDEFSKCKIRLANGQTINISLCAMSGSFELTKKKNVSYNNTLGVDLSSYKEEVIQLMYPIHISSCQHVDYKLIDAKKNEKMKKLISINKL